MVKLKTLLPKSEARKIVLERRQNISPDEVLRNTEKILTRLSTMDDFVYANKIHIYVSNKAGEVDTTKIISFADGWRKQIFLPKLHKGTGTLRKALFTGLENLKKNSNGFFEPEFGLEEDMTDIDLIFVPAIAVSVYGQRVNSGGGYYDRLLKNTFAPKYVVAFESQIFESIETDIHDIRIDKIITERRIIETRKIS